MLSKDTELVIDRYASHLPPLLYVLKRVQPECILEVGCGAYSTAMLSAYAAGSCCEHHILEGDATYLAKVQDLYNCEIDLFDPHHLPDNVFRHWDLAFIDNLPEKTRAEIAVALKEYANVIVLHDSNPNWEPAYRYSKIIPMWNHSLQFTELYPHTLVLTDDEELWGVLSS